MMRCFWTWPLYALISVGGFVVTLSGCTLDAEGTGDGTFDAGSAGTAAGGSGGSLDAAAGSGGIDASGGSAGSGAVGGASGSPPDDSGPGGIGGEAGAGGAAGQGATGGTGGTTFEKCDDGVDNDGDGNPDCADDECQALRYQCTPPVPEEWVGYFRVHVSANGDPVPVAAACPAGSMPERYFSGKAGPAACGACTCGDLQGAQCAAPGIACDGSSDCANAQPRADLTDFGCHDLSGSSVSCMLTGDNPVADFGTCEPSPVAPDFPNKLPFTDLIDTCYFDSASTATGCGGENLCIAPGSGEYGGALCVMQADDQAVCPPQWDAKAPLHLYKEEDVFDGRGCEPCTCTSDQTSLQCVGGSYKVWDLDDCNDCVAFCKGETSVSSTSCKDLSDWADSNSISIKVNSRPQPQNGKCNAGGGAATGYVETAKGVTFCCLSI
jgi:hypothetical protein